MIRLAFAKSEVDALLDKVQEAAPKEYGAFYLLREFSTDVGARFVASSPYFPLPDEWDGMHEHQLTPSGRLLSAMVSRAVSAKAGLLFIHSHPNPRHPTGFSDVDLKALESLAGVMPDLIDGPLGAAVVGPNGWVGLVLRGKSWRETERITSAGRKLSILNPLSAPNTIELDDRQVRALGKRNDTLRNLDVAVVGCGGLGSPVSETLVRMGVRKLAVIDHDVLDHESNVRRVFGSKMSDIADGRTPNKARVVGDHCGSLGLGCEIEIIDTDVRTSRALGAISDCDVVMCGTDSHSSRAFLNDVAYALHLPMIDCGVRAGVHPTDGLESLIAELRFVGPDLPCLWCRRTLSSDTIREENLPKEQREQLKRERYVVGANGPEPSVASLTVFGAGMMAAGLTGMIASDHPALPHTYRFDALFGDSPGVGDFPEQCVLCTARIGSAQIDGLMSDSV